ncbi:P-loop NTPase fold protein [Bacillus sp. DJP31]|uniref:P-loop NTPase fold protein n=1 Tax=Bacillus sp. DJP31 TaxID=3409789 RepID=UPI003BB540AE
MGLTYIFTSIASNQLVIVNDLLLIVLFIFGWMSLQLLSQEKKDKDDDLVDEESDVEITSYNQLLPTRKKEYARIIDLLKKNNYDEPFALLLNGDWGVGKTSLINVLSKKLEDGGNFKIFIQPMILDTTEKQMEYFFGQLEDILSLNGIFTGKDSPFKKYVNILFQTINTVNMKQVIRLDGLLDNLNNDEQVDFRSSKKRLEEDIKSLLMSKKLKNNKINENEQIIGDEDGGNLTISDTKKKIYIIIDDFDRVEEETFKNTLIFIKELVNFKGINVIFLMDEQKIDENKKINRDYLDKFVNRKYQLSRINHKEIISHFKQYLISGVEIQNDWTEDLGNTIKENIVPYIDQVTKDFGEEVERIQKNIENLSINKNTKMNQEKNDEVSFSERHIELNNEKVELEKMVQKLNDGISNVRRTKKIIREIKEILIDLDHGCSKSENFTINVRRIDRLEELIVRVAIFKILFGERLDKLIQQADIFSVMNDIKYLKNKDHLLSSFFITFTNSSITEEKGLKMDIMNDFCNALMLNRSFDKLFVNKKTASETILIQLDDPTITLSIRSLDEIKDYLRVIMFNSYEVKSNIVQARKSKLIDHINTLYNEEALSLKELFVLLGEPQRNPLLDNELYLAKLREVLNSGAGFENTTDKTVSLHYLKEITMNIFIRHQNDILMLMSLLKLKDPSYRYENFRADLGDIVTLEEMVKAIKRIFNEENNSISDLDFFKLWFYNALKIITSENEENLYILESVKHFQNRVNEFIKMYQIKEELVMKLKNISVDPISKFNEKLSINSSEELIHDIEEFHDFICMNTNSITSQLLRSYSSLLVWLERYTRSTNFKNEIIDKVEELYNSIPIPDDDYDENSDENRTWLWCTVKLGEIKENLKRLRLKQEKEEKEDEL